MNSQNPKRRLLAACMLVGLLASTGLATRQITAKRPGTRCLSIFASEQSALITDGCTSPVGFCAAGTFSGNHGFKGSSFFRATSFVPIPNDPEGRQVVPGESTYTTEDGAITISDVSVFDAVRGTFSGIGRIVHGTGRFAGATGDIFTSGRAFPDGSFTNEIRGDICLPN